MALETAASRPARALGWQRRAIVTRRLIVLAVVAFTLSPALLPAQPATRDAEVVHVYLTPN